MDNQISNNVNAVDSYVQLFVIAQENLEKVCREYKNSRMCKRTRRWKK